jgi:hypothetical protein
MQRKAFKMSFPYLIQGKNIVVVINNTPHTITSSHISYDKVKEAIRTGDWETVQNIIEPKKVILEYGAGNISIQGDKMFWKDNEFHNTLANRIIGMYQDGFPIEPMIAFMENLMSNPSKRAVDELYTFLEKGNLPITPDGYFLAYKKVRKDYLDIHSGTMDNSVGKIVEMERNTVDDNANNTCSTGLHFCSLDYLEFFGGRDSRVMVLKINPRDVVSIPADYNATKGRACRYEVIDEIGGKAEEAFVAPVQVSQADGATADLIRVAVEAAVKAALAAQAAQHIAPTE